MLSSVKNGFSNAGTEIGTAFVTGLRNETQTGFLNQLDSLYNKTFKNRQERDADFDKLKADYNDTADGVIHNIINGCDLANESIDTVTESIDKQNLSWVKNGLKAVAANVGITLAITAVISIIGKAINAWKEARAAAHDAMTDYSDISTDTDTIIEEYKKLNDVISDNESTIDEVNAAKERMYELQQNVIDTYGNEAKGIDFVNGKYADQIRLVRKLQEEKANEYIRENRYHLNEIADNNSDTYAPVFEDSVNFEAANKNFLSYLEGISDRMDSFRLYKDGGSGLASIALDTTVLRGKEDLETLKGEFDKLLRYVENDFEKQFVENVLDSIELAINKWEEDHEQDYNTGAIYGQALAESSNETIRHDGQILDVSDIYFDYADAIEAYNAALKSGVEEEIAVAEAKLNSMQGAVDKVISFAPTFELDEEQLDMFVLAFEKLQEEIDGATAKQRELKNELAAVWDGSDRAVQFDSTITGMAPQYINKNDLENIKELNKTQLEFLSLVKSDESSAMFKKLQAAADAAGVEIEDIVSMLADFGLFVDIESEIVKTEQTANDAIKSIVSGLSTIESNIKNLGEAMAEFKDDGVASAETLAGLAESFGGLDSFGQFVMTLSNSKSTIDEVKVAVNNLAKEYISETESLNNLTKENAALVTMRLKDIGVANAQEIVERKLIEARVKEKLETAKTTEEILNSIDALFEEEAAAITDANALEKLRQTKFELKLSSIDVADVSSDVISSLLSEAKAAGIAAEKLGNLAAAQRLMASAEESTGRKAAHQYEMAEKFFNKAKEDFSVEDVVVDFEMPSKYSSSSGSSSKTEKYKAEIDKLYKALEKQKEIEEDITDTQRARDALEEDDYSGHIKNIYEEISALERLNENLHEQNEIRRSMINQNIADLKTYGFSVSYNSAYNELLINNYENLNSLVTSYAKRLGYSTEKTNELIKSVEALIEETHSLNDANKENSATWQDNTQAVKDYLKEIKELKGEMVDDYLSKKENYLSHMQDFELWDAAQTVEYLEGLLHDLEDFYNAGLIDYETFVEEYQSITNRIYDSRKESLETVLDMIEDMVRQELDDQVDAYEEQKDALSDIIDAKKKIIELTKEENDYNKSLQDKVKEMAKLQERIAILELDDSREAAAEKATLIDQLAELQSEVDSMQYDKSIEMQESALDEMQENEEEAIDKQIEKIEEMADDAGYIHSKVVEKLQGDWDDLYADLVEWNAVYGSGVEADVQQPWENATEALKIYRDELGKITTAQAALGTVNEFMPSVFDTADSVIAEANKAEISNIVDRMQSYASRWSWDNTQEENDALAKAAFDESLKLPALGVTADRNPKTGEWIITQDKNDPTNVGKLLYDTYHTGGTVGELKDNELFALLEKGEDVLTEQQQRIAVPLLKAGIDMLNLSEGARSVFDLIKKMATPNLSMLRDSNESLVYAPEVNVTVTSNGGDADEIANAVKDRVLDAINGTFNKMGVSSKFKSIRV